MIVIESTVRYLCDQISLQGSGPICIKKLLAASTSNVVFAVAIGERWDYDHETRKQLDHWFHEFDSSPIAFTGFMNSYIRYLRYMKYFSLPSVKKLKETLEQFTEFMENKSKLKYGEKHSDDLIGAYLEEAANKTENTHFNSKLEFWS